MTGADRFEILEIDPVWFEMTDAGLLEILETLPGRFEMTDAGCNKTINHNQVIST